MSGHNGDGTGDSALKAILLRALGQGQEATPQKIWGALFIAATALGTIALGEEGDAQGAEQAAQDALDAIYEVWEGREMPQESADEA